MFAVNTHKLRGFWCSRPYGTVTFNAINRKKKENEEKKKPNKQKKNQPVSAGYPASLLVTSEDFRCGRSCGVGMWSPVTRFLLGPALGSCLFFIFALAML